MADNMPTEPILQHEHDLPDIPPEHSPRRHCRKEHVGGSENATPAETDGESDVDDDPEHARQLALETSLRHAERQLEAKPPMDVVEMRHEAHPTGATVATVIAVALLVTATFGFIIGTAELKRYYLANNVAGGDYKKIAWIPTVQVALALCAAPVFTWVKHPAVAVIPGTVAAFGALIGLAFCTEYYQFLLAHILFGLGASVWLPAILAVTATHSSAPSPWYHGFPIALGGGTGALIYPVILHKLFAHFSFRTTILITAGITAGLMLPSWILIWSPRRFQHYTLSPPWSDAGYAFLVLGTAVFMINIFSPIFYAPVLTMADRISKGVEDYAVVIIGGGLLVGALAARGISFLLPWTWAIFVCSGFATSMVAFAFWTGAKGTGAMVVGLLFYGITTGVWASSLSGVVRLISPPEELGTRLALLAAVGGLAGLAGPPVCAVLIKVHDKDEFLYAGVYVGLSFLVGSMLLVLPQIAGSWARQGERDHGSDCSSLDSSLTDLEARAETVT